MGRNGGRKKGRRDLLTGVWGVGLGVGSRGERSQAGSTSHLHYQKSRSRHALPQILNTLNGDMSAAAEKQGRGARQERDALLTRGGDH